MQEPGKLFFLMLLGVKSGRRVEIWLDKVGDMTHGPKLVAMQ